MMIILQLKELPRFFSLISNQTYSFALSLKNIYLHSVSSFIDFLDKHIPFKDVFVYIYLCAHTCRLIVVNIMTNVTALKISLVHTLISLLYLIKENKQRNK